MSDIPDEELMMMYQQGNVVAFELLFERYRNFIFSVL